MRDSHIHWVRKKLWIPPFYMQGIGMHAAADVVLHSIETVAAEYNEVTAVGMGALQMAAGEFINGYIPCPKDLDPQWEVGFKVCWTALHDGAGAANASFILLQNAIANGAVIALPATALDTIINLLDAYVDTVGAIAVADWLLQWTKRGIRNNIGLTRTQIEDGAFITLKLEADAIDSDLTTMHYIGMEMDYVPMKTLGSGNLVDQPLSNSGM